MSSIIFLWYIALAGITVLYTATSCSFPKDLRGQWIRSRDDANIVFSDTQLTGLNIRWNSQRLNSFDCYSNTGENYIINSTYISLLGDMNYFVCWRFVKVTSLAYIMFEVSDLINSTGFDANVRGYVQPNDTPLDASKVCTKSTYFTTLVKQGVAAADVAATCPPQLNASFTYSLCSTTELSFCQDDKYGVADYGSCSMQIFYSVSGTFACMGFVPLDQDIYINFFSSGRVICFKIPDKVTGTFSGVYYNGDCSTVVTGVPTSITLTKKNQCGATSTTITTTSATTSKETTLSEASTVDVTTEILVTRVEESKGADSATVGVAVGLSVGLFALVLVALLLFLVIWRQKLVVKVSDSFTEPKIQNNNKDEKGMHTRNEAASVIDSGIKKLDLENQDEKMGHEQVKVKDANNGLNSDNGTFTDRGQLEVGNTEQANIGCDNNQAPTDSNVFVVDSSQSGHSRFETNGVVVKDAYAMKDGVKDIPPYKVDVKDKKKDAKDGMTQKKGNKKFKSKGKGRNTK